MLRYLDEYRDPLAAEKYRRAIHAISDKPVSIMEICGGQTHSIVKFGVDQLLPPQITLVHGPGCPVCVTPVELIDKAIKVAQLPGVIFTSFGDMMRVPGSDKNLFMARAAGGDVRMVYSPLDALTVARENPDKEVVFFAIGFETTAPTTAMAVLQAAKLGLKNFSLLVSHVLVPPAMEAVLSDGSAKIDAFLAAGHVCVITGYEDYEPIAPKYRIPIIVTGFEPLDLLQGIYMALECLKAGEFVVKNQYSRAVQRTGNFVARKSVEKVFQVAPQKWRGIGEIPASGLAFRAEYAGFDAEKRFDLSGIQISENPVCISGQILRGLKKPHDCPAFGRECTPDHPFGATMVSSEGACAAYYKYRR